MRANVKFCFKLNTKYINDAYDSKLLRHYQFTGIYLLQKEQKIFIVIFILVFWELLETAKEFIERVREFLLIIRMQCL